MRRAVLIAAALCAAAALWAPLALAQPWPSKPVHLMAPGKTPDVVVERLAAEIGQAMSQPDIRERFAAMGSETPSVRTRYRSTRRLLSG